MMHSTIPSSRYDVVVIGARCAGAATAMLLARSGQRVLMVDRGRYGTDTLSTHALMRAGVIQLHRWGLLPAIIDAGTPSVRRATFYYGDEAVVVPIKPRDGIDALYAPRRTVLDRVLVDAASGAGVDVVYGARIRALQYSGAGRVTGVYLEDESGTLRQVTSRMVVGADGMRSTVAQLVGAQRYRVGQHASATIYAHCGDLEGDGYGWYFAPGLSAAAIPTNDGEMCVSLSVPGSDFTRLSPHRSDRAFVDLLSLVAPRLSEQVARLGHLRIHGFPGHVGFLRQAFGPGWALVGDAGYFKDPLTAHGITDALRDADLLARAIGAGSDRALAEYQDARDALSVDLFEATDAIASFNWTLTSVRILHEALARAMSREVSQEIY